MKILITGANGFVGGWLTKELSALGHEVIAVVKDEKEDVSCLEGLANIRVVYCDLSALSKLPNLVDDNIDVVYHLAWISAGGPGRADYHIQLHNAIYASDMVNVAMELHAKKILFAGTISERLVDSFLSTDTVAANNIYALSKHTTHHLVDILCKKNQIDYVWMQFANLYGPRAVGNIVSYTLNQIAQGQPATFGPATQPYDFIYIEDLTHIMTKLGTSSTNQHTYYLGSGNPRILSEYLLEIGRILQCPEMINIGACPDDGMRFDIAWFNNGSIKEEFDFTSSISFKEGISKTWQWMQEHH